MHNGLFITFEGPDGSGKSTQIRMLTHFLSDSFGMRVVQTREPGGTALAERFRDAVKHYSGAEPMTLQTELFLFEASRSQHVKNLILPALADGKTVICDRFCDSTTAYQGYGRNMDLDFIAALNRFATGNLVPDITFLMDLPAELGLERAGNREEPDRMESAGLPFHEKVRRGFLALAEQEKERFFVLDGRETPDVIAERIRDYVLARIQKRPHA